MSADQTTKAANYSARAGQTIVGNLARGSDGKFSSGGGASAKKPVKPSFGAGRLSKPQKRAAARARRSAGRGKGGKAGAGRQQTAAQREIEQLRLESARERVANGRADRAQRAADRAKREIERANADAQRAARQSQRDAERNQRTTERKAEIERRRAEAKAKAEQKRGSSGGGGKGSAKPKPDQAAERDAQRATNRTKVQADTLDKAAFDALTGLADGETPAAGPALDSLVNAGLVERDSTGAHRVSSAGRAYIAAANSGDVGRARDAMSRANDRATRRRQLQARRTDPPVRGSRRTKAATDGNGSLTVVKQANGAYRWFAVSSTAFQDRDGEIVSLKALRDDCARADATGNYGVLRFWHIPRLDLGRCDFNMVIGRSLVESGTFYDDRIGQALARSTKAWRMSLGFYHPRNQPDADGVYSTIVRFERSILPANAASNLFTNLIVTRKESTMSQAAKLAQLQELLNDKDLLASLVEGIGEQEKAADAAGVKHKEAGEGEPAPAAEVETKAEGDPVVGDMPDEEPADEGDGMLLTAEEITAVATATVEMLLPRLAELLAGTATAQKQAGDVAKLAGEVAAAVKETKTAVDGTLTKIDQLAARISGLEGDQPAGYRASVDPNTVTTSKEHARPQVDELAATANWLLGSE